MIRANDWSETKSEIAFCSGSFSLLPQNKGLFNEAFTSQQVAVLKAGGLPEGRR